MGTFSDDPKRLQCGKLAYRGFLACAVAAAGCGGGGGGGGGGGWLLLFVTNLAEPRHFMRFRRACRLAISRLDLRHLQDEGQVLPIMRAALVAGLLYFVRPSSQHFWLSWTEPVLASQHLWLNWTELPLAQAVQPVDSRFPSVRQEQKRFDTSPGPRNASALL